MLINILNECVWGQKGKCQDHGQQPIIILLKVNIQ